MEGNQENNTEAKGGLFIGKILKKTFAYLSPGERKKSIGIIILILLTGLFDVFGLASVLPVIYMAADTSVINQNAILNQMYEFSGIEDVRSFLVACMGLLFVIFLLKNIFWIGIQYLQSKFSYQVASAQIERQYKGYFKMGYQYFKETNSNVLARNISINPTEFAAYILLPLFTILSEMVVLLFIVTAIAIFDFKILLLLAVVLIPTLLVFFRLLNKKLRLLGEERNAERAEVYRILYENIHGYTDILISGRKDHFFNRFISSPGRIFRVMVKLFVIENLPSRFIEIVAFAGITVIFMYALLMTGNTTELISFLVVFATAAYRLMPSISRVMVSLVKIRSSQYVFDIMDEVKGTLAKVQSEDHTGNDPVDFNESFEIKNVSFSFPGADEPVLKNFSLKIHKGDVVGFAGQTGAGKTTIFNIILRLLQENSGDFLVDGDILSANQVSSWREKIAFVRQDFYLLDGSMAENIAFGYPADQIDQLRLNSAVKGAALDSFVSELKDGLNTKIGEHGGKLSGGQKQRVAIARALYNDAEIILFDEATSALDSATEEEIIETINALAGMGKTVLIIAHRLSTLKKCNRIIEVGGE